jgi:hypothetical protein
MRVTTPGDSSFRLTQLKIAYGEPPDSHEIDMDLTRCSQAPRSFFFGNTFDHATLKIAHRQLFRTIRLCVAALYSPKNGTRVFEQSNRRPIILTEVDGGLMYHCWRTTSFSLQMLGPVVPHRLLQICEAVHDRPVIQSELCAAEYTRHLQRRIACNSIVIVFPPQ